MTHPFLLWHVTILSCTPACGEAQNTDAAVRNAPARIEPTMMATANVKKTVSPRHRQCSQLRPLLFARSDGATMLSTICVTSAECWRVRKLLPRVKQIAFRSVRHACISLLAGQYSECFARDNVPAAFVTEASGNKLASREGAVFIHAIHTGDFSRLALIASRASTRSDVSVDVAGC